MNDELQAIMSGAKVFGKLQARNEDLEAALKQAAIELGEAQDKCWVFYCNAKKSHPDSPFMAEYSQRFGEAQKAAVSVLEEGRK